MDTRDRRTSTPDRMELRTGRGRLLQFLRVPPRVPSCKLRLALVRAKTRYPQGRKYFSSVAIIGSLMRGDMGLLGMGGPERDCAGDAAINHSIVGRWRWSCLRFILAAVVVAGGSARAQEADHAAFAAPVENVAPAAIAEPTPQQAGSGQSGSCTETAAAVIEETSESQRSDPACGHSANALINRDVAAGTVVEVSGRESKIRKLSSPIS